MNVVVAQDGRDSRRSMAPLDGCLERENRAEARIVDFSGAVQRRIVGGATGAWSSGTTQPEMSKSMNARMASCGVNRS
jgi:hypothetical protein